MVIEWVNRLFQVFVNCSNNTEEDLFLKITDLPLNQHTIDYKQ